MSWTQCLNNGDMSEIKIFRDANSDACMTQKIIHTLKCFNAIQLHHMCDECCLIKL